MSNPIILSDDDTPLPPLSKKRQIESGPESIPTILVLDDDPTPQKTGPTPFVAETPMSDLSVKPRIRVPNFHQTLSGCSRLICLESENDELEVGSRMDEGKANAAVVVDDDVEETVESFEFVGSVGYAGDSISIEEFAGGSFRQTLLQADIHEVDDCPDKENLGMEHMMRIVNQKNAEGAYDKNNGTKRSRGKNKITEEEKARLKEKKRLMKEQEKLAKAASKARAAEMKKMEKEKLKWEKGKFALQSIVAELDTKVVEQGSIGGHLLTSFANKGVAYRIKPNPIERSIVWKMNIPEHIAQLAPGGTEIQYVLLVFEAEEFCNLVITDSLAAHVSRVQGNYPSYAICYLTNKLMAYINKRDREQYKNTEFDKSWRRPPIEEVLAQLSTHFFRVHYRQCTDEAELAEHVVGLTCSLASCQFRKKLTKLSISANGSIIPKDFIDRNLIKKSTWLKALVAIPKIQPRFAIAIWKKYPTMKSLLSVYMDPNKSVHEKEFLLENLMVEGLLGGDRRVGQICSKRVYRILMAHSGSIRTDDVEDGADFFQGN